MNENLIARSNIEAGNSPNEEVAVIPSKTNREASRDYSVFSIDPNPSNFQSKQWLQIMIIQFFFLLDTTKSNVIFIYLASSRKPLLSRGTPIGMDHDDNKYKRRAPAEIFSRWSR